MRHLVCTTALMIAGAAAALSAPSVPTGGVVNVASYASMGLPNSNIAQGSMFVVFGTGLGPAKLEQASKYPLPTSLGGTSIQVAVGAVTVNAIIVYTSDGQVAAVMPSSIPVGSGMLTLTYNGQKSAPVAIEIVTSSFGIFAVNQAGSGPGIISDAKYNVYGLTSAAVAGETSMIWGTGLGPVLGNEAGGPLAGDMPNVPVEVYVGSQKAQIIYRGRSGCCTALDQIVFVVPPGTGGCHYPVAVKIGDVVSNSVTMAIASSGHVCSDPGAPSATDLAKYKQKGSASFGSVSLNRITNTFVLPPPFGTGQPMTATTDTGRAQFLQYTAQQLDAAQNPFGEATPGTCIVFAFNGKSTTPEDPTLPTNLDAGPAIGIGGPNGTKQLPKFSGAYSSPLGGVSGPTSTPLYLDAGSYSIIGSGGSNVGAFAAHVTVSQPLKWTNQDAVTSIQRSSGVEVTWSGGDPLSTVQVGGSSIRIGTADDGSDTVGALFQCTARVSDGKFTVPAVALLSLPASSSNPSIPIQTGTLSIGTIQASAFTASGLDAGTVVSSVTAGKGVSYR